MAGYIGPDKSLASNQEDRKDYIAASGQTQFAARYNVGYVDVYVQGVKLTAVTDYTATNGSTVTLTVPAVLGDEVSIVGRISSKPYDYYFKSQVDEKFPVYGIATGTSDSLSVTTTPLLHALIDGLEIKIRASLTNTTATPTVTFSNLGTSKTITKYGNQPLLPGDINPNQELTLRYNATTDRLEITFFIEVS